MEFRHNVPRKEMMEYGWSETGAQRIAKQMKTLFRLFYLSFSLLKLLVYLSTIHYKSENWENWFSFLCGVLDNLTFHNIFAAPAN